MTGGLGRKLRAVLRGVGPRLAGLVLLIAAMLLRAVDPAPLEVLRLKTFDLYQLAFPRVSTQERVVIVDIDEEILMPSGNGHGREPGSPSWSTRSPMRVPLQSPLTYCFRSRTGCRQRNI